MPASRSATETRIEIQKLNELPPVSVVAQQFLAAVERDVEVAELAAIVEQDPSLLARIVGLANSAYFGYPERIYTAHDAIMKVLGVNTAKNLALSIVLSGPFKAGRCPSFRLSDHWAAAMLSASLARDLARRVKVEKLPPGECYLGGLLHGIGLLALVYLYPERMAEVFATDPEVPQEFLVEAERAVLGSDHLSVGGWLARKWHLPAHIVQVLERHQERDYQGELWPLVRLVGLCARWVVQPEATEGWPPAEELAALGIDPADAAAAGERLYGRRQEVLDLARLLAQD